MKLKIKMFMETKTTLDKNFIAKKLLYLHGVAYFDPLE